VDGLDQTPYARGKPNDAVAQATFLGRHRAPGLDVLHGEVRSPCYDVVHSRRVVFVAGEYWLLEDRLRGDRPHRYDTRFHLAVHAGDDAADDEVRGTGRDGRARDWIACRPTLGHIELGPLRVLAVAAWLRQSESGAIVAFGACNTDAVAGEPMDSA